MTNSKFLKNILTNIPKDWLRLTTHRLDIYNEQKAKIEFLEGLESISIEESNLKNKLESLPTSFDYIRLGHPLSCVLEWAIAKDLDLNYESVISFASQSMGLLSILRHNLINGIQTQIVGKLPNNTDAEVLKNIYHYNFIQNESIDSSFEGTSILLTSINDLDNKDFDIVIGIDESFGSVVVVNTQSRTFISEIQHVRRRESIAMTPRDCESFLKKRIGLDPSVSVNVDIDITRKTINSITHTKTKALIGSSGLSVQYAIMMGLTHYANDFYPNKDIKFIVPPNCYGGTNDQARRVAACITNVEILDLPVDSGSDMVSSLERILEKCANEDSIPFVIAEIPTNPRVEIPVLEKLKETLLKKRETQNNSSAIEPVFILDQTFCPNVNFLGAGAYLDTPQTISYVSGSKFPSGGLCTAGYCVANDAASKYIEYIEKHLKIANNTATNFQIKTLEEQMPSMLERIKGAYENTRNFVDHIENKLPNSKINFVSHKLADLGFTPSVFSLDLPAKSEEEKRELNHKLISMMIEAIPSESKHCVSYGQLHGCYWTIPATSTQGTTKEGDKDYIVRVAASSNMDVEKHKEVFSKFCESLETN